LLDGWTEWGASFQGGAPNEDGIGSFSKSGEWLNQVTGRTVVATEERPLMFSEAVSFIKWLNRMGSLQNNGFRSSRADGVSTEYKLSKF